MHAELWVLDGVFRLNVEEPHAVKDSGDSLTKGEKMKTSTKDQAEGKLHQVTGAIREAAGKFTKDPSLEAEGNGEKLAGKVQAKIGQVEKVLGK